MRKIILSIVSGLAVCGCTIHPIPYDVPGYRTIDIVKKIRCEAKRAIDKFAQDKELQKKLYDKMTIGYHFTFSITENNKVGVDSAFKLPLTNGTFTLGVAAGADRQRLGERDFTLIDNFKEARDPKVCDIEEATGPNYAYPITGVIGLEEVIWTYLELVNLGLGDLQPPPGGFEQVLRAGHRARGAQEAEACHGHAVLHGRRSRRSPAPR